jgi:nitrate reductase NapE
MTRQQRLSDLATKAPNRRMKGGRMTTEAQGNTQQALSASPRAGAGNVYDCHVSSLPSETTPPTRREEIRAFVFLAFVLAPVLSVLFVGGYGFIVWIVQTISGPPGPPDP